MNNRLFIGLWLAVMATMVVLRIMDISIQVRMLLNGVALGLAIYHTIFGITKKGTVS